MHHSPPGRPQRLLWSLIEIIDHQSWRATLFNMTLRFPCFNSLSSTTLPSLQIGQVHETIPIWDCAALRRSRGRNQRAVEKVKNHHAHQRNQGMHSTDWNISWALKVPVLLIYKARKRSRHLLRRWARDNSNPMSNFCSLKTPLVHVLARYRTHPWATKTSLLLTVPVCNSIAKGNLSI